MPFMRPTPHPFDAIDFDGDGHSTPHVDPVWSMQIDAAGRRSTPSICRRWKGRFEGGDARSRGHLAMPCHTDSDSVFNVTSGSDGGVPGLRRPSYSAEPGHAPLRQCP